MVNEIENFYGCYLLYSKNPKFKGHTYIGFTVDPNRRINQHNAGRRAGGACRTSGRGPWEMVLIIHGFPNEISALRFEWAWQHPGKSRRLRHIASRKKTEQGYRYRFRVACEMLRVGPWNRLPLTLRWLNQDYALDFESHLHPPVHMAIAYGPVKCVKVKSKKSTDTKSNDTEEDVLNMCAVCSSAFEETDETLHCLHAQCDMQAHIMCLQKYFLRSTEGHLVPIESSCPRCQRSVLWGDLVRYKRGCYQNSDEKDSLQTKDSGDHWTNKLTQI